MLDDGQLRVILELGGEPRSAEFKGQGNISDKNYVAKVARAALALANFRGGGWVILGIEDSDPLADDNGLSEDQVRQWTDIDTVNAKINTYADPALEIQVATRTHPGGGTVVVIQVEEFRDVPIMCRRDYGTVLAEGQLYTRSAAKTESSSRKTHGEMREVIELAVDKNLQQFLQRSLRGGLSFSGDGTTLVPISYSTQLSDAETAVGHTVVDGPHFRFSIRPATFERHRLELNLLRPSVMKSEVRHYGWSFPSLRLTGQGQDWVAGEQTAGAERESWRFFRSGLFAASVKIYPAEKDRRLVLAAEQQVSGFVPVYQPVVLFSMVLEFAARLQAEIGIGENLIVGIEARDIRNYALAVAEPREPGFWNLYEYSDNTLTVDDIVLAPGTSIEETRPMATLAATKFFHHFGWLDASPELLQATQSRVIQS